jgi:Uma2 family endonuclease
LAGLGELGPERSLLLTPDFVIELAAPACSHAEQIARMLEYQENGVRLGWLILPAQRQVYSFAEQGLARCLDDPYTLGNETVLPGFRLDLALVWEAGFQS